ncbi:triacylglycerol lipase 2-like [Cicer arietinum]|uniref:Lipase n=1 Tax=Cicer arietinum TaxID=3827 RepID=A0A1S2XJL2_CICAR|nr:triacylglycerol lipase 2-like [Cicer arietinum]
MALLGSMNFAALTLCVLVLAAHNYQAQASSRVIFGKKNFKSFVNYNSSVNGLCATSVIIRGYKCQEFEVTTPDGYILSIQRIPEGRYGVGSNVTKKEPVLIQHGVLVDGTTWFLNNPEQNLPMILADEGFDVWISNTRGTQYSRKHTTLDSSSQEYWNWSWDELVTDEMPAIVDFVYNQSGQQKINYVGHSLGTLVALASFSKGILVDQLKSAVLLSPIAYLSHMTTELGVVAAKSMLGETLTLMHMAEFDPKGVPVVDFMKGICAQTGIDCNHLFSSITGENCCLDTSAFDLFMNFEPQSSSTKNLFHLAQTVRSGVLTKFDYERPDANFKHYRQVTPPIYNLSNIPNNLPIFMSYGGRDALSDVIDVNNLLEHFKYHDEDKLSLQFIDNYAHADFIMAVNANDLVYKNVTSFFKRQF